MVGRLYLAALAPSLTLVVMLTVTPFGVIYPPISPSELALTFYQIAPMLAACGAAALAEARKSLRTREAICLFLAFSSGLMLSMVFVELLGQPFRNAVSSVLVVIASLAGIGVTVAGRRLQLRLGWGTTLVLALYALALTQDVLRESFVSGEKKPSRWPGDTPLALTIAGGLGWLWMLVKDARVCMRARQIQRTRQQDTIAMTREET